MMKINHKTTTVATPSGKSNIEWQVTLKVDEAVHQGIETVKGSSESEALQKAWIFVKKNEKKYGISEDENSRVAIEVHPIN